MLDFLPQGSGKSPTPGSQSRSSRSVQVMRAAPEKTASEAAPQVPFAKTSADEPERRPRQVDFIGSRNSVASGEADAPQRLSDAPLPTMAGRDGEHEVVTFDQERQDGALEHESKASVSPAPPTGPALPAEQSPPLPPQPSTQGSPDGNSEPEEQPEESSPQPQPAAEATAAREQAPQSPAEGMKLADLHTENALTLQPQLPQTARLGLPEGRKGGEATSLRSAHSRTVQYDPSLASNSKQPGMRTYERRTRSTGRFVIGRRPALNVAATARGRYEAELYRRIARMWYAACDEHRGDIIPGSITVSLRLTKDGRLDSMDLVRRRGASLIQQSFSFGAIRRAALPPMPPEVQRDIIGNLYEMIITFNFD